MAEAERYKGVSLLVNYATCVMQGIDGGMCNGIGDAKMATETGYWPLYRFNPSITEEGKHRFQLDSKRMRGDLEVRSLSDASFQCQILFEWPCLW